MYIYMYIVEISIERELVHICLRFFYERVYITIGLSRSLSARMSSQVFATTAKLLYYYRPAVCMPGSVIGRKIVNDSVSFFSLFLCFSLLFFLPI